MRIIRIVTLLLGAGMICLNASAQDKWDLRRCVQYAMDNNISIKQSDIDARTAKVTYEQSKYSKWGNLNAATALGLNFGRSIDQTTNVYTTTQGISQYINLNASVNLFNWFSLRRATEAQQDIYSARVIAIDKSKNDVTLNVANAYLKALLAKEQVTLAKTKLQLTSHQLANTKSLVDAGSLPELNAAELEVQFATDTAAVISAEQNYDINTLLLKAILNLDAAAPFDLDTPPVETIPLEPISSLQPDAVYAIAINTFPQQKMNDLLIAASQKNVASTRGTLYPTLSIYGALGDNFFNNLKRTILTPVIVPTGGYALDGATNTQYPVYIPSANVSYGNQSFFKAFTGYGDQLQNNFGQQVGLQLNIPIFDGYTRRSTYKQSKLNVITAKLNKENDLMSLKQGVYQAYYNAVASLNTYEANKKAVVVAERSFDLSTKRYNIGMLNTIDYLVNQNALFTARINVLIAQYNYVFTIKTLEYYKGLGIKL